MLPLLTTLSISKSQNKMKISRFETGEGPVFIPTLRMRMLKRGLKQLLRGKGQATIPQGKPYFYEKLFSILDNVKDEEEQHESNKYKFDAKKAKIVFIPPSNYTVKPGSKLFATRFHKLVWPKLESNKNNWTIGYQAGWQPQSGISAGAQVGVQGSHKDKQYSADVQLGYSQGGGFNFGISGTIRLAREDGTEETIYIDEIKTPQGAFYLPSHTQGKFDNLKDKLSSGEFDIESTTD